MAMERIDIRVEAEILDELEGIAGMNNITNRSEAVREAIYSYIDDRKDMWNSDVIRVAIPKRLMEKAEMFIRNGDAKDLDQAIFIALNNWCDDLSEYYTDGRGKLEKAVAENIENDMAIAESARKSKKVARR